MKVEIDPMQQPARKVVGRLPTASQQLAHLEDLTAFLKKHAHESFARAEGDCFPIRKKCWPPSSPNKLIFLKEGSWREKNQLDIAALREIIARGGR